jgi:hypothetical protein
MNKPYSKYGMVVDFSGRCKGRGLGICKAPTKLIKIIKIISGNSRRILEIFAPQIFGVFKSFAPQIFGVFKSFAPQM